MTDVQEHQHGAVLYEFQVIGTEAGGIAERAKLNPNGTYLLVRAGKSLLAESGDLVTMSVSAGPAGKDEVLWTHRFRDPGFQQLAIDLSKWDGKTVNINLQTSGDKGAAGVWLAPQLVKGKETLADLIGYWKDTHSGSIDSAIVGAPQSPKSITCQGKSQVSIQIPLSAGMIRRDAQRRLEQTRARYGASDERLQARVLGDRAD